MSVSTSVRAVSRLSNRTTTTARLRSTHVQHIAALLRTLVQQVTGVGPEDDPDEFQYYVSGALDTVLNGSGPANDMPSVTRRIAGHREKARIHLQTDLADAITTSFRRLNTLVNVDPEERSPDDPIKRSNLPEMLQILIELSQPPTNATHEYAYDLLREVHVPPPEPKDFWKQVLEEEPLEGEHWKTPWDEEDWDTKSLSSHPSMELESRESLSSVESVGEDEASLIESKDEGEEEELLNLFSYAGPSQQHTLNNAHSLYEALCADQYWRSQYVNDAARRVGREFNVNDPATLGPSFERALEKGASSLLPPVREPSSSLPRVSHLTITAYRSLLSAFAATATTLHHLRIFVSSVLRKSMNAPRVFNLHQPDVSLANASTSLVLPGGHRSTGHQPCRALDAFAEAVGARINSLDEYCASLEERICNARLGNGSRDSSGPVVVSLLSLRRRLDDFMARTFDILYDLIRALPDELPSQTYAHPRDYYPTLTNSAITILSPLPIFAIQNLHPALLNKRLLDRLLVAVRACNRDGGGDTRLASDQGLHPMDGGSSQLMEIFIATAEPIWAAVGAWVKWGIDVGGSALDIGLGLVEEAIRIDDLSHDREFFIKRREAVDVASPDFWTTGYVLRTTTADDESDDEGALDAEMSYVIARKAQGLPYAGLGEDAQTQAKTLVPSCLIPVAARVLAAGKAVGLLRGIGVWGAIGGDYDSQNEEEDEDRGDDNDDDWPSFADTLKSSSGITLADSSFDAGSLEDLGRYNLDDTILPESSFSIKELSSPTDTISGNDKYPLAPNLASEVLLNDLPHILADRVAPRCQIAAFRLNRVLVEDCELWRHLHAMEDLCFMRRGDIMTNFCDNLFAKIEAQKPWSDYHLLNSLFRDVISATPTSWIDLGRVRLVYRGTKARSSARSIRAVHGLEVEYEKFPFPLPYVFGTNALRLYSQVFVLVLQLRRAKMVLDRILVRDHGANRPELKMIYVLRGQLTWFVNTYMNYILMNVVHSQVLRFHKELADAKSLDEMIVKHKDHIETVQEQCFLRNKDAMIHKTILSILDMCVHFGDLFTAVVADNTLDISRPMIAKGRRSRRDRSRRQNLVSFIPPPESDNLSTSSTELSDSEDDSEDDNNEEGVTELGTTMLDSTFLGPEDEDSAARVERLSKGLDTLVRTLRKRVELAVGEGGPSSGAFGMLDFALEDWDL
ncbi:hypothetical protein FRC11_014037 [Ceratobasidium sp. 423]|nr:hypothetical protein FRC11_014037 [Ceratobasidium sp. 423]